MWLWLHDRELWYWCRGLANRVAVIEAGSHHAILSLSVIYTGLCPNYASVFTSKAQRGTCSGMRWACGRYHTPIIPGDSWQSRQTAYHLAVGYGGEQIYVYLIFKQNFIQFHLSITILLVPTPLLVCS
jgi:hypothetical protein